jgi:hypothetical protein
MSEPKKHSPPEHEFMEHLDEIFRRVDKLPTLSDASEDEILDYDEFGIPRSSSSA